MWQNDMGFMAAMQGWWWLFWLAAIVVVCCVLIGLALFVVGNGWRVGSGLRGQETTHEVLRRRLAAGEVGEAEFLRLTELLEATARRPGT